MLGKESKLRKNNEGLKATIRDLEAKISDLQKFKQKDRSTTTRFRDDFLKAHKLAEKLAEKVEVLEEEKLEALKELEIQKDITDSIMKTVKEK